MTEQEKITNFETLQHIIHVRNFLDKIIIELLNRGELHDNSKLEEPELATFVEYTPKLAQSTYGSEKYIQQNLKEMKTALVHHYAGNRHHPEHFKEEADATLRQTPVNCMNLVDIVEMLCDWKAATMRHDDGDIMKSIEINRKRFLLSDQLVCILKNTVMMFE